MSSKQLFFNNHLMRACVAAVFAFGLAACSSSNDAPPVDPEPEAEVKPMPEPEPEPQALAIPAGGILGGASNLGLGAEDGATSTLAIAAGQSATRGNVTFTCPESAADGCTVTFTNEAGQVQVSELGGVAASIPPRVPSTPGVPPVTATEDPDISGTLSVDVTRGGESTDVAEFKISHQSYPDATGPTTALPSPPGGWAGVRGGMTGDGEDATATDLDPTLGSANVNVIAASTIELATHRGFYDKYPPDGKDKDDKNYIWVPADTDHSLVVDFTLDHTGDTFDGNFDGVPGTYTCHSGPCSIVVHADIDLVTPGAQPGAVVTGIIRFSATTPDNAFKDVQDADYLTLAAWNHWVGGNVIETAATYGASQPLTAAGRSTLAARGHTAAETFNYQGLTVGVYYSEAEDAGIVTEDSKLYTGTVALRAIFSPQGDSLDGSVTIPAQGDGSIEATSLTLEKTSLSEAFAANGNAGTQAGPDAYNGTWAAQFVGDGTSVGGTYGVSRGSDAANTLERFDGAFGATQQ